MLTEGDILEYKEQQWEYLYDHVTMFGEHIFYFKNLTTDEKEWISIYNQKFWTTAKKIEK